MPTQTAIENSPLLCPKVIPFFDKESNTFSYVVRDPTSNACAIIDSVLDFDYASGTVTYEGADSIINYVQNHKLEVEWIIETHVHADHLSAAVYIQERVEGKLGIGEHIVAVQNTFAKLFNEGAQFQRDGSQFDHLFKDAEEYNIGNLPAYAMHTPGHTPACMTHVIGDAAFVGDTLFMPDSGTARADFPGGDAATLFHSTKKILSLPDETRIFLCHDYGAEGREVEYETSVKVQKDENIHVNSTIPESDFVELRNTRDVSLKMPRLILPSLQVNMGAGHFPEPEDNGTTFLKVPINGFK